MTSGTGVLFDLDGTLVDSRDAILLAYRRTFERELGIDMPQQLEDPEVLMAPRPVEIFRDWSSGDPEQLAAAYGQYYLAEGYTRTRAFPEVRELVDRLSAACVPLGIVTNKGRDRAVRDLEHVGLAPSLFACLVTAEDSVERKPDPRPVEIGLQRAGLAAEGSWYVGDGPQDVLAGRAAGTRVAAAFYGYYGAASLAPYEPDLTLERPLDLMAAFEDLRRGKDGHHG